VITLTTGAKFMVRESPEEIIERVAKFRRQSGNDWRRRMASSTPTSGSSACSPGDDSDKRSSLRGED